MTTIRLFINSIKCPYFLTWNTLQSKKRVRIFSTVIYMSVCFLPMSVVSLPRPYLPVSTLYAFPHDCDDYGPLPVFIQLPKARDDNTLK